MSGRIYSFSFAGVSVSAVQDLLAVYAGAKAFRVHSVTLGQITQTAVGNLAITHKRLLATVTAGSGGSTPAAVAASPNDTAATITGHANDTTQATSATSTQIVAADAYNVINGYLYMPPEEDRPVVAPNQAYVISLNTAPGSAETMSGTIVVEELF
jgi:hypothetical protein